VAIVDRTPIKNECSGNQELHTFQTKIIDENNKSTQENSIVKSKIKEK
jgi:hypothetical protein